MRALFRIIIAFGALVLSAQAMQAKLTSQCFVTDCRGGNQTVICVTYDDATGRVLHVVGTTCDGDHWVMEHCEILPAAGELFGAGDHQIHGKNWSIGLNVNRDGALIDMWGTSSDGRQWKIRGAAKSEL